MIITEFAPAKINLNLHICRKRSDGYHLLHSLVVFASDIGDQISASHSEDLQLEITGLFSHQLDQTAQDTSRQSSNLVIRAAYLLADMADVKPKAIIKLEKNLPLSSGIGGGSSDAAATIKALCTLWNINPDNEKLSAALLKLGADMPVCYARQNVIMQGIGEQLTPYNGLPALPAVLVNPLLPCSTQAVFRNFKGEFLKPVTLPQNFNTPEEFCDFAAINLFNSLQQPALETVPEIRLVLNALDHSEDCLLSRLSGSGATCFAIYPTREKARRAAKKIQDQHKNWWVAEGLLNAPAC